MALIKAFRADTVGILSIGRDGATSARLWPRPRRSRSYRSEIVQPGEDRPEVVITPGIFVDRIVQIAGVSPLAEAGAAG